MVSLYYYKSKDYSNLQQLSDNCLSGRFKTTANSFVANVFIGKDSWEAGNKKTFMSVH